MSDNVKDTCAYNGKIVGYCEFCGRLGVCYSSEEIRTAAKKQNEEADKCQT